MFEHKTNIHDWHMIDFGILGGKISHTYIENLYNCVYAEGGIEMVYCQQCRDIVL